MRALVPPLLESFGDPHAAARTILAAVFGIHLDELHSSPSSRVAQCRDEFGPRCVVDITGKGALRKPLNIESFYCDQVVVANQPRRCLTDMFRSSARNPLVTPCDRRTGLAPVARRALFPSESTLRDSQLTFRTPGRPKTWDETPVGKDSKVRNTEIDADAPFGGSERRGFDLNCKSHFPTLGVAPEGAGTNRLIVRKRAMHVNLEHSGHSPETQARAAQGDSLEFVEAKAIPPSFAAETRKPCLPTLLLHATEKTLVRLI